MTIYKCDNCNKKTSKKLLSQLMAVPYMSSYGLCIGMGTEIGDICLDCLIKLFGEMRLRNYLSDK